jgi:hypothetical protein
MLAIVSVLFLLLRTLEIVDGQNHITGRPNARETTADTVSEREKIGSAVCAHIHIQQLTTDQISIEMVDL